MQELEAMIDGLDDDTEMPEEKPQKGKPKPKSKQKPELIEEELDLPQEVAMKGEKKAYDFSEYEKQLEGMDEEGDTGLAEYGINTLK